MLSLENKTILVTGSAQGIGEAGGRVFAQEGAAVVLTDIAADRVTAHAEAIRQSGGEAMALHLDVTDPGSVADAVEKIVQQYGQIDGVFHNAMSAAYVNNNDTIVTELSDEVWHRIIGLTLTGTFNVMRAVGREMLKQGAGSMVLTATVDALIAQAGIDAYSAAKGGVISLARSAAAGLSPPRYPHKRHLPRFRNHAGPGLVPGRSGSEEGNRQDASDGHRGTGRHRGLRGVPVIRPRKLRHWSHPYGGFRL